MYRRILLLLVFGTFIVVHADSATQTDWSGGDGVLGPVLEWGSEFYQSSFINWSYYPGSLRLLIGDILEHTVDEDFGAAKSVYSEDIDGDGDMDMLGAAYSDDDITWWENIDGSGTSWTEYTIDGNFDGAYSVYSEDIDGDGDMDVLGAAIIDDDITWWENIDGSGTSWTKRIVDGEFLNARTVYSEDINEDGYMDIIGAGGNYIAWWENIDGSGTSWTKRIVNYSTSVASSVYSEDINGDGDMDILSGFGNYIAWWENKDGSGMTWTEHQIGFIDNGAFSVYSEDINGTGFMDVLCASGNSIAWWENIGGSGTSWFKHTVEDEYFIARSVYSEDINGDGYMDILGAARGANEITWWDNFQGAGIVWEEYTVDGDYSGANSVYLEDIDGDGSMDILGAASIGNDITWWDLNPPGLLESTILDTQGNPDWDYFDWNSQTPPGTSVIFQVRASDDHTSMGAWSAILTSPCPLESILNDGDEYMQYRAVLETSNPDSTPTLNDVTITWDPLGVGNDPQVTEYLLYEGRPNPAYGVIHISFAVPELSSVELLILDLTGHLVATPVQGEYLPGVHIVQIDELTPGIYFCWMISGDYTATQRFVVVK